MLYTCGMESLVKEGDYIRFTDDDEDTLFRVTKVWEDENDPDSRPTVTGAVICSNVRHTESVFDTSFGVDEESQVWSVFNPGYDDNLAAQGFEVGDRVETKDGRGPCKIVRKQDAPDSYAASEDWMLPVATVDGTFQGFFHPDFLISKECRVECPECGKPFKIKSHYLCPDCASR